MIGARVLPPCAGSPRRRRCSSTKVERRFGSRRGRQGPHSTRISTWPREETQETETQEAAELAHAWVVLAPAPRAHAHGEPDLVGDGDAVDPLQHELEIEGELELADDHQWRAAAVDRHHIATAHLAFHLEATRFEKALHGTIERCLQDASHQHLSSIYDKCRRFSNRSCLTLRAPQAFIGARSYGTSNLRKACVTMRLQRFGRTLCIILEPRYARELENSEEGAEDEGAE